jgi:fumarylacetoacetate (FAA) hydrolase
MKLASLKSGRDGRLVVVSRDITRCADATHIARTLQAALDDWARVAPRLEELAQSVGLGTASADRFRENDAASPLPRAFQWADGSSYVNHVELLRSARGDTLPASFWTDPLMYQGGSDAFLGPRDPIVMADEAWGIDMEGEITVVTDDVPMGVSVKDAAQHIKLIMLSNDVSLRALIPPELTKGFGFFHSKPSSSFSPVAVTPDELGETWRDGRVHLPYLAFLNGRPFGRPNAGQDMVFDFPTLIAHAAKTRRLGPGTIVGSGTVSNKEGGKPARRIEDGGVGYTCIAEVRTIETIQSGAPKTPFLRFGDSVRLEMHDRRGRSIFGAIEQTVVKHETGG